MWMIACHLVGVSNIDQCVWRSQKSSPDFFFYICLIFLKQQKQGKKPLSASGLRFSKTLQLHIPSWLGGGCRGQNAEGLRKAELRCHGRKSVPSCSGPLPMSDPLLGAPSPHHLISTQASPCVQPNPSTGGFHKVFFKK